MKYIFWAGQKLDFQENLFCIRLVRNLCGLVESVCFSKQEEKVNTAAALCLEIGNKNTGLSVKEG